MTAESFSEDTQSFAWRWPWEPKKQDGLEGAELAEHVRIQRQNENQRVAMASYFELLKERKDALKKFALIVQEQVERFKKHAAYIQLRKDVMALHAEGLEHLQLHSSMFIGSRISGAVELKYPNEGFPKDSQFEVSPSGNHALVSVEPITNEMLNELPEMSDLHETIEDGLGPNHVVSAVLRNPNQEEHNAINKTPLKDIEGRQIIAFDFVLSCHHPEIREEEKKAL